MRWKSLYFIGLVVLAVASYLVIRRGFDRQLFLESLWNIRPAWIGASAFGVFFTYLLRAVRWQRILMPLKNIQLAPLTVATILGFAAIHAAGRAGEVVRPLWIARQEGIPVTASFGSIVVERVFDTLMILALFAIGLGAASVPAGAASTVSLLSRAAWLLLAGSLAAVIGLSVSHRNVETIKAWIPLSRLRHLFESFTSGAGGLSEPGGVAAIAAYSILVWAAVALQFWLMMAGLNLDLTLTMVFLVMSVSALGSLAQIPGIGGGFQAGFVFSATAFAAVPTETAVAAALFVWIVTYIPTMLAGALYMLWKGISTKDLVGGRDTDRKSGMRVARP